MLAVAGVTAIEVSVLAAAVTVRVAIPLTPPMVAVMALVPAATAVVNPVVLMVAVAALELLQLAVVLRLAVEPSL
jgi:hypothetical protein